MNASPWHDNIFRFNISENDGLASDGKAGIYIWNSSRDANQFYNCLVYNNTIYNTHEAAISYSELSERKNFAFYNNIFVAEDSLIKGFRNNGDVYLGNDWWSIIKQFNAENITDFKKWAQQNKQEMIAGKIVGMNVYPAFAHAGNATITSEDSLKTFINYQLPQGSFLRTNGIDLKKNYSINNGGIDFFLNPISIYGIGACF